MFAETFFTLLSESGFAALRWQNAVMILISFILIFLAIAKKFEPLLLLPIAFGMLLANLPLTGINQDSGFLYYLYQGVKLGVYPSIIFLGIGAMTDFGPLIARPSGMLIGAGAQLGVAAAFLVAIIFKFTPQEAASLGIIGGADGPTAILLTTRLAPHLLAPISLAAYSYMALIPMIQPPLMRLLTTKNERKIQMKQLREVSKLEKICFPILVTVLCVLFLPAVAPLIGMLMLGNLFRESGVVERLSDTAQNSLINIVTIFLGLSVGSTASGIEFLKPRTLIIIGIGLFSFALSTIGGLLTAKLMCIVTKGKINPLIGSAGVSAVPMAARISQIEGQKAKPGNYLLMHAIGPNVSGIIGSAVIAGIFLSLF